MTEQERILLIHAEFAPVIAPEIDFEIRFGTIPGADPECPSRPAMAVAPNWAHLSAVLVVDPTVTVDMVQEQVVHYYLHELGHVAVSPAVTGPPSSREDGEEQVCTRLARAWYALARRPGSAAVAPANKYPRVTA